MTISIKVEGIPETQRKLANLGTKAATRATRKGVNAAAAPQKKALRARVPKEEGILAKSIAHKVRQYRAGRIVVAIVGARNRRVPTRRRKGGVANPANYLHLVDQGAQAHTIQGPLAFRIGDELRVVPSVSHPGVRAKRFMAAAARSANPESQRVFNRKFKTEIEAEAKKGA